MVGCPYPVDGDLCLCDIGSTKWTQPFKREDQEEVVKRM